MSGEPGGPLIEAVLADPLLAPFLQLDPEAYEPVGIPFGRTLFFYARESDLRRGDFSRAWYDSD